MSRLPRRSFLGASVANCYSLVVRAGTRESQDSPPVSGEERRRILGRLPAASAQAGVLAHEPNTTVVDLECDFLVAGGGISGVCAAISAGRHGSRVILLQDRSRINLAEGGGKLPTAAPA